MRRDPSTRLVREDARTGRWPGYPDDPPPRGAVGRQARAGAHLRGGLRARLVGLGRDRLRGTI